MDGDQMTPKPLKSGIVTTLLLLYTLGAPLVGGSLIGGLALLNSDWMEAHARTVVWTGAAAGTVLTGLALMPSILLGAMIGYYSKGSPEGIALAVIAIGLAAAIGIQLGTFLSRSHVRKLLAARPGWLEWFEQVEKKQGRTLLVTVFLARLSPHMPFAATNLLLAQLSFSPLLLTFVSWLGLLPRTLLAVIAGSTLSSFGDWRTLKTSIPFDSLIAGSFALIVAYIVVSGLRRRRSRAAADPTRP
jgi:uncharacterized membrane protein YdjX (TVP38/TMEM64 family)